MTHLAKQAKAVKTQADCPENDRPPSTTGGHISVWHTDHMI